MQCHGSLAQFCVWMQTHHLVQVHQRSTVLEQTSPFTKYLEKVRISLKIRPKKKRERMNTQAVLHFPFRSIT